MKAQVLTQPAPIESAPLRMTDVPRPIPGAGEVLVKVHTCAVCHTDLHVVEGDLQNPRLPLTPGHQIVGTVVQLGADTTRFPIGSHIGIPWLHEACGRCEYCLRGQENLCDFARFTGYTAPGGYAEYVTVPEQFAVALPSSFNDVEVAPLLCAGIVGYRSLRLADVQPGERLGLYGFGASAHICLQVARYWNCQVFVFTRGTDHQRHSLDLGATWAGRAEDEPPHKLDRAIIFAPAGWIVPLALGHLRKSGTLCINAIHTSPIPEMRYELLWEERAIRTVANATRQDANEFMALAAHIPLHTDTEVYPLDQASRVLQMLKNGQIKGAAVLQI